MIGWLVKRVFHSSHYGATIFLLSQLILSECGFQEFVLRNVGWRRGMQLAGRRTFSQIAQNCGKGGDKAV